MSWQQLLAEKRVRTHSTSRGELAQLRLVVARDLSDGQVPGLSADRRFACLYSAALQLAHMAIACAGYRVAATSGHHKTSLDALELVIGGAVRPYSAYLDICRRKRNLLEYDSSSIATETEVQELLLKVSELEEIVEKWIEQFHPSLGK
jgi:hypothetical protein